MSRKYILFGFKEPDLKANDLSLITSNSPTVSTGRYGKVIRLIVQNNEPAFTPGERTLKIRIIGYW